MIAPYYQQGDISIYCGDWRTILPTLNVDVDLVLTDPPYGDNHDTDYTRFSGGANAVRNVYKPIYDDAVDYDPLPVLKVGKHQIVFGANRYSNKLPTGSWYVWDKRTQGGNKNVMSDAEVAWYSRGRGVYIFQHTWDGFNRASERNTSYHPTQKPTALMMWCLEKAKPQGLVVDLYMGSGPTLEACRRLDLPCIGFEVEYEYCEVAARRLRGEKVKTLDIAGTKTQVIQPNMFAGTV